MCKWRGITIIYRWVKGVLYSCSFRKFRFIPVRHLGVMERETTILHSQDLQVALPSKERRSEDTREKEEQRGLPLIWAELFFKAYQQALAVVRATKHFTRRKQSSPCPLPIVLPSFCPQRNLTDRNTEHGTQNLTPKAISLLGMYPLVLFTRVKCYLYKIVS